MSLSIVTPDHATLMVDQPLLLGRHASSDVVLDDPLVSERHAQISPAGSALEVQDLGSTNGTYVNGMRILGPTLVHGGDVIRVGSKDMLVKGLPALAGPGTTGLLLTVRTGPDTGASVKIAPGQSILIGRSEQAHLRLTDPLVSANHCQISLSSTSGATFCSGCGKAIASGEAFCTGCSKALSAAEVKDLGSSNGVLINRSLVRSGARQAVTAGTDLQIGDSVISIEAIGAPETKGPAPTMFRPSMPMPAIGQAAQLPPPIPAPAPARRMVTLPEIDLSRLPVSKAAVAAIVAGVVVVAIFAIVGLFNAVNGGNHDAAWVRAERGPATVQVAAFSGSSNTIQTGSGSIIDAGEGLVLTNFHVLADDYSNPLTGLGVKVRLDKSSDWINVAVVGYSGCDDLALLRITSESDRDGLRSVHLADSGEIQTGMTVVALGFPGTLEGFEGATEQMTVTQGIVSKTGVVSAPYRDLIQIDADINRGSSGGPLFDLRGNQIGVNTLGMNDVQGVNYAISSAQVKSVLPEMKNGLTLTGSSCN